MSGTLGLETKPSMSRPTQVPDSWSAVRRHTEARVALGRAGGSLPTAQVLEFGIAHAAARDAVNAAFDVESLVTGLNSIGLPHLMLATMAHNRETYLRRPDLGRRLDEPSRTALRAVEGSGWDVALIVADGLSPAAAASQVIGFLRELLPMLRAGNLSVAPHCIVRHGRVAVEDEIGSLLGVKVAVILIGERPGLAAAESLGAYLVFDPRPGRTDAERNCVSNIRPGGLGVAAAAATIRYLITESLRRGLSGVMLKDQRTSLPASSSAATLVPTPLNDSGYPAG